MPHPTTPSPDLPLLTTPGPWAGILTGDGRAALEQILPRYLVPRRWFGSKARTIQAVRLAEAIPLDLSVTLTLLEVHFTAGEPETYVLPLTFAVGEQAEKLRSERPNAVVANLHTAQGEGVLYDAVWNKDFDSLLLDAFAERRVWSGEHGDIAATSTIAFPWLRGDPREPLTPHVLGVEQSNTNVRYGKRLLLKLFRRLEVGVNPDQEIGVFLTEKVAFAHVPPLAGALVYHRKGAEAGEPISLALLQGFVPNQGDAWRYTLDSLQAYFERSLVHYSPPAWVTNLPSRPLLDLAQEPIPDQAAEAIGLYLDSARLLGQRTAELHLALASQPEDPVFGLEPFSLAYRQHLQADMHKLTSTIFQHLRHHLDELPAAALEAAQQVLALEERIVNDFDTLLESDITALRERIHGDYHLGQVLYTGDDFMIIDFEGEPARPLSERRQKGSPLQDVAGMLRSFHYAAYAAYFYVVDRPDSSPRMAADLEAWARTWHLWVSVAYLQSYLEVAGDAPFMPAKREELKAVLDAYLLSKAVYELGYELNNRPHWVAIPLQGILQTAQAVQ
ncbi:MAG TPA: putative maltokinase [Anaerolineae bacterium]|nr:putative maltokinase [Anaerolineae bacterium]